MVARPGDDVRKHMTASFINKLQRKAPQKPTLKTPLPESRVVVDAIGSGDVIKRFHGCNIIGPATPEAYNGTNPTVWENLNIYVDLESEEEMITDWGVAQGRIDDKHSHKVVLLGLTWAIYEQQENGQDLDGDYITYRNGKLWRDTSGKGRIITPAPEVGSGEDPKPGLILLSGGSSSPGGSGGTIEGVLVGLRTETTGYYAGLKVATVEITEAPCDREDLMPEVIFTEEGFTLEPVEVDVVDHSGCIFDHSGEELDGVRLWATERISVNPDYDPRETIPDPEDPEGPEIPNPDYNPEKYTPCHWCADDRCCVEADFPEEDEGS